MFAFYRTPKAFFQSDEYKDLSAEAKILYGILLDRVSLSAMNEWKDEAGRVFIYCTLESIQEALGCAHQKATKLLRELEKAGLLERKKQGLGKPDIIYVMNFADNLFSAFKSDENHHSGELKISTTECLKSSGNNTDKNYIDINNTNPILSADEDVDMDERRSYKQYFDEQLCVDALYHDNPYDRVLRPAFQLAVDDDLIRKNPFGFQLVDVVINDSIKREAISREEERKFMKFIKEDAHYCRYYDGMYILFKTGLRISEFCGLTLSDIDFKNHRINVDHQLQKKGKHGYYIEETKTDSGTRVLPMSADVEECFKRIIENRNPPKIEPMVDGRSGFLFFDKDGSISYSLHWEHYFKHALDKYNGIYKVQLPTITSHVCRHTYCTNMAKSGMNPKALQYLMGHSDISVTLNVYTHVKFEDAKAEIERIANV